jgi:hypothetical protein
MSIIQTNVSIFDFLSLIFDLDIASPPHSVKVVSDQYCQYNRKIKLKFTLFDKLSTHRLKMKFLTLTFLSVGV